MLSETLRFELAPLNVRVMTVVAGNVSSHMSSGVNWSPPTQLPPTSYYRPIEKEIAKPAEFSDMDTMKFANEVVSAVVSGATGNLYKGGNVGIVRWMVPILPSFIYVSLRNVVQRIDANTFSRIELCSHWDEGLTRCRSYPDGTVAYFSRAYIDTCYRLIVC